MGESKCISKALAKGITVYKRAVTAASTVRMQEVGIACSRGKHPGVTGIIS